MESKSGHLLWKTPALQVAAATQHQYASHNHKLSIRTKNRVSIYHDAPLMAIASTARYFLNQPAINAPSTYLHRGCFK
jgi:hypothetical protein